VLESIMTVGFLASVMSDALATQVCRKTAADDVYLLIDDKFLKKAFSWFQRTRRRP